MSVLYVSKYVNGFMHLEIEVHCCNEAGKFFANKHFLTGCKYEICVLFGTLRRTQVRLSRVGSRNIHIIIFQHAICRWLQHPLLANALRADARKAALLAGQGACRQGALGHHSEVTDKMSWFSWLSDLTCYQQVFIWRQPFLPRLGRQTHREGKSGIRLLIY